MKRLVVYDSMYGNTEKIAQKIASTLKGTATCVDALDYSSLEGIELLVVGSPVHGGRPTPAIDAFIKQFLPDGLKNIKVAAFDTRFAPEDHGVGLRILMNIIRFAAERIGKVLKKKGGMLIVKPEGFIVQDKKGPLKPGELARASYWALEIEHLL